MDLPRPAPRAGGFSLASTAPIRFRRDSRLPACGARSLAARPEKAGPRKRLLAGSRFAGHSRPSQVIGRGGELRREVSAVERHGVLGEIALQVSQEGAHQPFPDVREIGENPGVPHAVKQHVPPVARGEQLVRELVQEGAQLGAGGVGGCGQRRRAVGVDEERAFTSML